MLALPVLLRLDRRASFRPEVSALLRGIDFLSVLAVPALERLAQQARPMELAAGTVVIRQGEPGDAYYLVESGRLEVAVAGRPERVVLGPGDGFGEIALLLDVPRTATVSAIESCRLWVIERSAFVATITGSAGVALAGRQVDERLQRLAPDPSDAATGA